MKKWLRRFAKLLGWLLLLLVLFIIEENVRGRILLATYRHQLRAAGEKLTLAELGLTNVPAPPDSATIDLLDAAKKLGDWNVDNRWEAKTLTFMRPVMSGAATFSWQVPMGELRYANPQWVTNTWPIVVEQLCSNAPALSAAIEALRKNPQGVPHDYRGESDQFSISANVLRDKLQYWLMWATANNLREGKLDAAGETVLAMAELGKTFQSHHPGFYRQFMQHGLDATWELLQSGATNDEQLSTMQEIWSKGAIIPDLPRFGEAYRAWNLERIEAQTWRTVHDDSVSHTMYRLELHVWSPTFVALWFLVGRSFDEYGLLVLSQDKLAHMRAVGQTRRWGPWQEEAWHKRLLWCLPWPSLMPFTFGEDWYFSEGMLRGFEFETHREMTVAAIALQRFRLRHGRWPEKLDELVPELLPTLPRDWMDGQPLRYRRNADGTFTLYSVGEDLRDDGGDPTDVPVWNMDAHPQPLWRGRDAVWPCVATEENVAALKRAAAVAKKLHR